MTRCHMSHIGHIAVQNLRWGEADLGAWREQSRRRGIRIPQRDTDGRADLLWNTQGAVNRVYGSLGTASGGLDFSPQNQLHPVSTDWDQFTVYLADVNGNGRQDVIWNHAASENRIYVAISRRQN